MSDGTAVYEGAMPARAGQLALETRGMLGGLGLIAIWIGTVAVNAMNDYSGSLALQAAGVRVRRPVVAVIVTVAAAAEVLSASLKPGWEALLALLAGFAAATPFMDTSLFVGYASSHWLQGGDIAFAVGFVVALAVYGGIRRAETGSMRDVEAEPDLAVVDAS